MNKKMLTPIDSTFPHPVASLLFMTLLATPNTLYAQDSTINYWQSAATNAQSTFLLEQAWIKDPTHNGLSFNFSSDNTFLLTTDLSYHKPGPPKAVEHFQINGQNGETMLFRRATNNECGTLACSNSMFPPAVPQIQTQYLEINNAVLHLDAVELLFGPAASTSPKTTSTINLNNGTLSSDLPGISFGADQHFNLNAQSGDNIYRVASKFDILAQSNALTVSPGASLKFLYTNTHFVNETTVDVDSGDLILEYSQLEINDSPHGFNVSNGSLQLLRSTDRLRASNIDFDNSNVVLKGNTRLDLTTMNLTDSVVTMDSGSVLKAEINSRGNTQIVNRLGHLSGGPLGLGLSVIDGHLNIDSDMDISFGTTTIQSGAALTLENKAGPSANVLNSGTVLVRGDLAMGGIINTIDMRVDSAGSISPRLAANDIAEILIKIPTILGTGALQVGGGQFNMHLNPLNTTPTPLNLNADLISVEGNITGSGVILMLDTAPSVGVVSASDYDQKEFTLVKATGNLELTPTIKVSASMPALLEYRATDLDSVAGKDISIVTSVLPVDQLPNHPSIVTDNTNSAAQLLAHAAQGGNTNIQASLNTLTNEQVSQHMNSIHAEPFSSHLTVNLEQADNLMNFVMHSTYRNPSSERNASSQPSNGAKSSDVTDDLPQGSKEAWVHTNRIHGDVDGVGDLSSFDYDIDTYMAGNTFYFPGRAHAGFYIANIHQNMSEHDATDMNFNTEGYHLGGYGELPLGDYDVQFIGGVAWLETDSKRQVSLGGTRETARASYDSQLFYTGVNLSRVFRYGSAFSLKPFAGLAYIHHTQESFQESGAPTLGLSVDNANANSFITSLGVAGGFIPENLKRVTLSASLRYDYDLAANRDSEHSISAGFIHSPGVKQDFFGQNRGAHSGTCMLSVDHRITEALKIGLDGLYTYSENGEELGASLRFNYTW